MFFPSSGLNARNASYFLDAEGPVSEAKSGYCITLLQYRRFGGACSAAFLAVTLHGLAMAWLSNLPEPVPRTAAMPLPTIALELAAQKIAEAPAIQPPPAPPIAPVRPEAPKRVVKPKPKRPAAKPLAEKEPPAENQPIETPQALLPQPLTQNNNAQASPANEAYIPPKSNMAYLNNPRPVYPMEARRQRLEGLVVLKVFVTAEGQAEKVKIERSSGHEVLDDSALAAVRQWRFVPAKRGDNPEAGWATVPVNFSLG